MSQLTIFHCRFCQGLIPIGRIDRVYCSKACKQKAYRWRNKVSRYASEIDKNINLIAEYLEHEDTREEALETLSIRRAYIAQVARFHGYILKAVK